MVFSSVIFLFFFLPFALLVNAALPRRAQNVFLLLASLLFYAWGEVEYTAIMLASMGMNYLFGLWIASTPEAARRRVALAGAVVANLGLLVVFKYANFFVDNLNALLASCGATPLAWKPIHLPIGISFFTFHALSYVGDVYRRQVPVQRNPIDLGLYIALFPQLIAGPIVRYQAVAAALAQRRVDLERYAAGIRRFVLGLAKKVLIANSLAIPADHIFGLAADQLDLPLAWLGLTCFALQIYFDFSGYSDMALGLGKLLGFDFPENFDFPYLARSVREFWTRWHISLSTWFRDYLYIPLGGNRTGRVRTYRNLVLVFFLCGLWHGAAWTFLIWGLLHGCFLVLERAGLDRWLARLPSAVQRLYLWLVVGLAWVFFRADDLPRALAYLASLFSFSVSADCTQRLFTAMPVRSMVMLAFASLACIPGFQRWVGAGGSTKPLAAPAGAGWLRTSAQLAGMLALLLLCSMSLASGTHNPFIYFRF